MDPARVYGHVVRTVPCNETLRRVAANDVPDRFCILHRRRRRRGGLPSLPDRLHANVLPVSGQGPRQSVFWGRQRKAWPDGAKCRG